MSGLRISISVKALLISVLLFAAVASAEGISFRQDVEPILTKAGCNAGQCHGKLAGQNGFKLSLRGYAPELDYQWLTSDVSGRRINFAAPSESLMVLKPLGKVFFASAAKRARQLSPR